MELLHPQSCSFGSETVWRSQKYWSRLWNSFISYRGSLSKKKNMRWFHNNKIHRLLHLPEDIMISYRLFYRLLTERNLRATVHSDISFLFYFRFSSNFGSIDLLLKPQLKSVVFVLLWDINLNATQINWYLPALQLINRMIKESLKSSFIFTLHSFY